MAFIYIAFGVYLGIVNDGKVTIIMGEKVVSYFAITPIVVKAAGVFLAIIGAHENEKKSY